MEKGKFRQFIKIRGANEHNLNNISVDIPRNELVVLTGDRKSTRLNSSHT